MVATGIVIAVIRAEMFLTDATSSATGCAKTGLALRAWLHRQRPALTTGTFDQAVVAIGLMVNRLIKAGADDALAGRTTDQTVLAEALPASATGADLSAVLLTPRTAHGAFAADVGGFAGGYFHLVYA